jgi:hypothetical protein
MGKLLEKRSLQYSIVVKYRLELGGEGVELRLHFWGYFLFSGEVLVLGNGVHLQAQLGDFPGSHARTDSQGQDSTR